MSNNLFISYNFETTLNVIQLTDMKNFKKQKLHILAFICVVFYDLIHVPTLISSKEAFLKAVKLSQSKMRYPILD